MDYYKIENIEKFLRQELSSSEMTSFEKAMAEDAMLKDTVDGYRFMKEDGVVLEEMLQKSKQKFKSKRAVKKRLLYSRRNVAIAASLIVLLGLASILQFTSGPNIKDYDFKDAGLPVHLDAAEQTDYTKFTNFYKLGEYEEAQYEIDLLLDQRSPIDTLLYYKACILKEQKNYAKAIEYYHLVHMDSEYAEKSDYQKAMCYWYLENEEDLIITLKSIVKNPNHLFYNQSLLLLKKL